jgi:hypothetical protein
MLLRALLCLLLLAAAGCVSSGSFDEYTRASARSDLQIVEAVYGTSIGLLNLQLELIEHEPALAERLGVRAELEEKRAQLRARREELRVLLAESASEAE